MGVDFVRVDLVGLTRMDVHVLKQIRTNFMPMPDLLMTADNDREEQAAHRWYRQITHMQ